MYFEMIEYVNEIPSIDNYWPLLQSRGWNNVYVMEPKQIAKAISNSSFAVSAYHSDKLVGFAKAVSAHVMYATIYDVMVLRQVRGQCKKTSSGSV